MSDLPNVFYKPTDTKEQLYSTIQYLQKRLMEQAQVVDQLQQSVKNLQDEKRRLASELLTPQADRKAVEEAQEVRKALVVLKDFFYGI